jgi:hypothetical protein
MRALYNVAYSNDKAKAVLTAHSQSDPSGNANKLYQMLKTRFLKKDENKLQLMINELNSIMAKNGEELTALVDRLEKMYVAIKAIDSVQFPADLALVGVLKKSISVQFQLPNGL